MFLAFAKKEGAGARFHPVIERVNVLPDDAELVLAPSGAFELGLAVPWRCGYPSGGPDGLIARSLFGKERAQEPPEGCGRR